jgi:hypothetical protein
MAEESSQREASTSGQRWVLEPARPGEINLQIDIGEGAKVPDGLRQLLEQATKPSEGGASLMADAKCIEVHVSACYYYTTCKIQL